MAGTARLALGVLVGAVPRKQLVCTRSRLARTRGPLAPVAHRGPERIASRGPPCCRSQTRSTRVAEMTAWSPAHRRGCPARIRQERKRNATALRKIGEDGHGVVANGREPDTVLPKVRRSRLKLRQLRLAVGPPVGRSVEHEHKTLGSHQRRQRLRLPFLIEQREIGYPRSDLWPKLLDVREHRLLCRQLSGETDEPPDNCTGNSDRHAIWQRTHEHTFLLFFLSASHVPRRASHHRVVRSGQRNQR